LILASIAAAAVGGSGIRYAAWTKGAKPEDIELIKAATERSPLSATCGTETIANPLQSRSPQRRSGWGGWIRTNVWRDQNPLPYRLATPQRA
jgi:hypothetical protein